MNSAVVKNAVGELDKLLSEARAAVRQIEADIFQYTFEGGGYEYPEAALEALLTGLHDRLLVVLEAAELPGAQSLLIEAWKGFASEKKGLRHLECNG